MRHNNCRGTLIQPTSITVINFLCIAHIYAEEGKEKVELY